MTRYLSTSFVKTYAAWLLLPILGSVFALLAVSSNLLTIALSMSSFLGILLLRKPVWNTELVIILGLFVGFIVLYFGEPAIKLVWGISILGFMLLTSALYRLMTLPHASKSTPLFIWLALAFFLYAIIDSVLQLYSAKEMITAFKRYFQVWGLLFGLCWLGFSKDHIARWCKIVFIICLLQAPFCLYERLILVPIRESYVEMYPNLVPIDVVAGTFGSMMFGGGNDADMAISLIIMFAFLLSRFKTGLMSAKQVFWLSCLLLSPLLMGETKIVIFLFPLMFLTLYHRELLTRPHYAVAALIFGSFFTVVIVNAYMIVTKMSLDALILDTLKYNVYEVGYGGYFLNRTSVLVFWWQHQSLATDPISFLFGNGLGSAELGSGDSMGGHINTRYPNYGIGLTAASMLLWELGVIGVSLFLLMMVTAWRCANQIIKLATDAKMRADATAIQAAIVLFTVYPIYTGSLLDQFACQLMFTAILGYLAWMYKNYAGYKS
jgi:hypothetical protein